MREYVTRQGGSYVLPLLELMYENCHLQLFRLLENVPTNSQLCAYSVSMFPRDLDKLNKIDLILTDKNLQFHFVFERLIIKSINEMNNIFNIEKISNLIISESEQYLSFLKK